MEKISSAAILWSAKRYAETSKTAIVGYMSSINLHSGIGLIS